MRAQWFSDVKDIVKWSTINQLALSGARPTRVLYVAMRTEDEKKYRDRLLDDGTKVSDRIYEFFRGIQRLDDFPWPDSVRYQPYLELITHRSRGTFFRGVQHVLSNDRRKGERTLLFLDPDTGIEPSKTANQKHVLARELRELFGALTPGDLLAVYQHKSFNPGWLRRARAVLARATDNPIGSVEYFQGSTLTKELAVLVVRKNG